MKTKTSKPICKASETGLKNLASSNKSSKPQMVKRHKMRMQRSRKKKQKMLLVSTKPDSEKAILRLQIRINNDISNPKSFSSSQPK